MGISFRKSKSFGPLRLNFSKKGVGLSLGVKGLRVGTKAGASGVYLRGGKGPVRVSERLDQKGTGRSARELEGSQHRELEKGGPEISQEVEPISLILHDAGTKAPKSRVRLDTLLSFEGTAKPDPK